MCCYKTPTPITFNGLKQITLDKGVRHQMEHETKQLSSNKAIMNHILSHFRVGPNAKQAPSVHDTDKTKLKTQNKAIP